MCLTEVVARSGSLFIGPVYKFSYLLTYLNEYGCKRHETASNNHPTSADVTATPAGTRGRVDQLTRGRVAAGRIAVLCSQRKPTQAYYTCDDYIEAVHRSQIRLCRSAGLPTICIQFIYLNK